MSIDKENKKTSEELAEEAAIQQAMMVKFSAPIVMRHTAN